MVKYYEFKNSVKILSGENALENINYEFSYMNCKKPLVITDSMLRKLGTLDVVIKANKNLDTSVVFSDVPVNSSIDTINELNKFYKQNKCDGILAVGGGSVIDTAKGLKMMLTTGENDLSKVMGNEIVKRGKQIPFIVVPTTSGTGSEATLVAVIADEKHNRKMEFISYEVLPDVAVIDIRMTLTLPPKLTATTGVDALCHAIEAYSCAQKNPLSDAYAISAIKLIMENLVPTVVDGKFTEGRIALANASLMAGIAFSNSMVGLCHAIAHSLGGICKISHGEAIGILLPETMRFNLEYCRNEYSELLFFLAGEEVYFNTPKTLRAERAIEEVENLLKRLKDVSGIATKLSEKNVPIIIEEVAKSAINDGAIILNKRNATKEQIEEILKKVM